MSSPFVSIPADNKINAESASDSRPDSAVASATPTAGELTGMSLKGYALAVKDLFHIKGLPTAAGNPDWLATHSVPTATNSTVEKLLDAGATFKGKTITDELAYSLHGQNKHYPQLVNPIAPAHIPGGSSSGSAVAVSAHLADIGLGTDTGGSIRVPASYQGLWGLRTTHNAIPCDNMVALAPSFDTIGWMTRDLDTLEKVSQVCLVDAPQKELASPQNENGADKTDVANSDSNTSLVRIGAVQHLLQSAKHGVLATKWLETLNEKADSGNAGFTITPITEHELDLSALNTAATFRVLQGAEIWQQHGQWITETSPDIAHDIMLRLNWCETISEQEVEEAKKQQVAFQEYINSLFETVDVLLIPTTPGIAPRCDADEETLANDRNALLALTSIAGLAELPQIHMPLFTLQNAPCGLSLVGKKGSDLALIKLAKILTA
ncbi:MULTISPECIES: amidase [Alteromonas]|uniref:Amidase n=1 Tax=Alteromonas stellipolaris TaxID=233316 RepID=A0ABN4LQ42_9ALTE|nr:amidase [Alteromonas stellipolaris]ALM91011.1 Amidase [Alteromonas stellipolaris LMG 21856]AMJ74035.1 amidase [Alteromonas stellipolaris]